MFSDKRIYLSSFGSTKATIKRKSKRWIKIHYCCDTVAWVNESAYTRIYSIEYYSMIFFCCCCSRSLALRCSQWLICHLCTHYVFIKPNCSSTQSLFIFISLLSWCCCFSVNLNRTYIQRVRRSRICNILCALILIW